MTGRDGRLPEDCPACEGEPIHAPGSIQPHGVLLAAEPGGLRLLQASVNAGPVLGRPVAEALGRPLDGVLAELAAMTPAAADFPQYLRSVALAGRTWHALAHRADGVLLLELEQAEDGDPAPFAAVYPLVRGFVGKLQGARSIAELAQLAACEVRGIACFDRVLVYRFDENWNGAVIAEDRNDELPSYLDLRFPASDFPRQARELYRVNRLRLIADAARAPVPIEPLDNPLTGRPLCLGQAALRCVSPVQVEYMRNMGTAASMTLSLLSGGELWGLISCHNRTPKLAPYHVRTACDLLGQILSLQLAARERAAEADRRVELRSVQARLLAHMAEEDRFLDGMLKHPEAVLRIASASGAAVALDGRVCLLGSTPDEADVRRLLAWLDDEPRADVWHTDRLPETMPDGDGLRERASGALAIALSELHPSYLVWFRPEAIRTVSWSGDPRKPATVGPSGPRLHPRTSFEAWKETVRGRSLPWSAVEVDAARELRTAIVGIVLRKAEELAALSGELERSNRELEAFSYSVSHDLRAPFRHIVGYSELLREQEGDRLSERGRRYLGTIAESAMSAGQLVDDLLSFSRMGRMSLHPMTVELDRLVEEERRGLEPETAGRAVEWRVQPLGRVVADPTMLRLALQNLLGNAIKYTRPRERAEIEIGARREKGQVVLWVRDNGVGFDMAYAHKLFGVFQRLHRIEEFEGTGIGLANVKRIAERHGGRVWANGEVGRGATFYMSLPDSRGER